MNLTRIILLSIISASILSITPGCSGPTYKRERLAQSLEEIFASDGLKASARFLESTLAVQLAYPDALVQTGEAITTGPAFDEALRAAIPAIHRIVLSSDADVQFYVLLLSDPNTPGAYLTMVRYIDDVRRAHANMLDATEISSRTVFDLNYVGTNALTIEEYVPRDLSLEEFLSWQLARRIQGQLMELFQTSGVVKVGQCGGQFQNGEFAFTLNISPTVGKSLDDETVRRAFDTSAGVIATVLSSYEFESFHTIRLIHTETGRHLVLPKARLEIFR